MATDPSILLLSLGPIPAACRTKLASDLRRTHRPRSLSKLSSSRSGKRLTSHARTSSNGRALARSPFGRRRRSGGGAAQILIRPCLERSSGAGGRLQTQLPPQSYILTSSLRRRRRRQQFLLFPSNLPFLSSARRAPCTGTQTAGCSNQQWDGNK